MLEIDAWAAIGFILAAYAVVGNDALQTLGTFITSNARLHWSVLFGFAAIVLIATFSYGYLQSYDQIIGPGGEVLPGVGDPSFGRLDNAKKYPVFEVQWFHVLPALGLLLLTRFGIPVSTSFMILAVFATIEGLSSMVRKSLIGYGLAFAVGIVLFCILANTIEKFFRKNDDTQHKVHWIVLQWISTTWLWSVWLMQDFANIFVFLPRRLAPAEAIAGLSVILVLLAITFANQGGPVQRVLRTKTAVTDIRSATIIDFVFAALLYYLKERSKIPMSTTWVFLGLIAGREYAFAMMTGATSFMLVTKIAMADLAKALLGLILSIDMARGLPWLAEGLKGGPQAFVLRDLHGGESSTLWFLVLANALLIPVALFLRSPRRSTTFFMVGSAAAGVAAFFWSTAHA